ncbi:programmed cell death 1 ligand 1-like [Hypanus sabinus]|uniref:programmed cell death 1 ligand 1-like n=1 Tax=Hypanus sabinus TaxID=79690 RepID=UPI0028C4FAE7|nr:programmed cell death 1 ligand 1-like [Hypanus sabinus]
MRGAINTPRWSRGFTYFMRTPAVEVPGFRVYQFPKNVEVPGGSNVTMYCNPPISKDTVNVLWWKEGENAFLETDSRKQFIHEKPSEKLILLDVKFDDSGMYYCGVKYQERSFWNGSGSKLSVYAPPTPLVIVPIGEFSSPRQLLCKTAAFYPKELEIVWQKNNRQIRSGRETVINRTAEGLYEAYSSLEVNQSGWGKDVYICLVSHVSLTMPACFSYILEQGADAKLIIAYTVDGLSILTLIIVLVTVNLKRSNGINTSSLDGCQNEYTQAEQVAVEHATAYDSRSMRENKGFRKYRQQEQRII